MSKWELAPYSRCDDYRILATEKVDDELYLTIMRLNNPTFKIKLSDVQHQDEKLIEYIEDLQPKILSGVYDIELMEKGIG